VFARGFSSIARRFLQPLSRVAVLAAWPPITMATRPLALEICLRGFR
jgi:hypothetical protein